MCLARSGCNQAEWRRIVFSDETRFQLYPDDHRRCVWRHPEQRAEPAFTIAPYTGPQPEVRVCGAISFDRRTLLVVIRGTITAPWYVDDIMSTVLLPAPFSVHWLYLSARKRPTTYDTSCYELSYSLSNTSLASQIIRYLSS
ncbi:transposable element Tc1 transposase [Trichonephila clavipes]|nr:transposable element Tc1 transposase [Trichonephila clavipes]